MGQITEIAQGLRFPEGPVACADGSVLLVEMASRTVTRIGPTGDKTVVADVGGGPNGLAIGPDGGLYVCNNGGHEFFIGPEGYLRPCGLSPDNKGGWIDRVDVKTGEVRRLYSEFGGHPLDAPNDIVFDRDGGFWFTDFGRVDARAIGRGAVYYGHVDGRPLVRAIFPMLTPNGIGLSPDDSTLYVSETDTARVWAYPIVGPGEVSKQPWPSPNGGTLVAGLGGYQRFDSLAVEDGGNICVATLVRGAITVLSPRGDLVESVKLPEPYCTNICFGGPGRRTAFVTLVATGTLVAIDWPRPGLALHHEI